MNVVDLVERLRSSDDVVRRKARDRLIRRGGREVTQALTVLLDDPWGFVVKQALDVLAVVADPESAEAIENFARTDDRFDLVWRARHALAAIHAEVGRRSATPADRQAAYGPELVAEAILWRHQAAASTPGDSGVDGLVLVLLPSFHPESLVTIADNTVASWLIGDSIWKQANTENGMWPAGGRRIVLSTDSDVASQIQGLAVNAFAAGTHGMSIDGLRLGGFAVMDGIRSSLPALPMTGQLEELVRLVRGLGVASHDPGAFEYFRDLGSYLGVGLEVASVRIPVAAIELSGACAEEAFPELSRLVADQSPAVIDMTTLGFLAPAVRTSFAELVRLVGTQVVLDPDNPYHPADELGPNAHDTWAEALAAAGSTPTLEVIGYWSASDQEDDYPSPAEFVDPDADPAEQRRIAALLDDGIPYIYMMGFSPCRICGAHNGAAELTDGRLVWPSGLSHYVRDHNIVLPVSLTSALRPRPPVHDGRWLIGNMVAGAPRSFRYWRSITSPGL